MDCKSNLPVQYSIDIDNLCALPMKSLAYLNKYLLKYRRHLILGLIFVIVSNIFQIVPAQIGRAHV